MKIYQTTVGHEYSTIHVGAILAIVVGPKLEHVCRPCHTISYYAIHMCPQIEMTKQFVHVIH